MSDHEIERTMVTQTFICMPKKWFKLFPNSNGSKTFKFF
jgi:hypothetical protein